MQINTCKLPQAREAKSDQVAIGFLNGLDGGSSFLSRLITERGKTKPMQSPITFDTL